MKPLLDVRPTPEQLAIFSRFRPGVEVIRGAAGSGKTTTAILKLRAVLGFFLSRKSRQHTTEPIRVLVLTFNRTLRGYVKELAFSQVSETKEVELTVETFAKWARTARGNPKVITAAQQRSQIMSLGSKLGLNDYLMSECEYAMGRFLPSQIASYLGTKRDGRGNMPRVDRALRERLVNEVIVPYTKWKAGQKYFDWNDLAIHLIETKHYSYDVVVVDEAQDFSANQIRAVMNQLNRQHSVTFVLDTAQRIYPRGFTWQEVGIALRPENSHRLQNNYRNTRQIAALALSLINGLAIDDDSSLPDFRRCTKDGEKPLILQGKYSAQVSFAIARLKKEINLKDESVAFLHPLGGGWYSYLRARLTEAKLPFVEITRKSEWPSGTENIALSTLHSAKGLEFDHVLILGLNAEVLPQGEEEEDHDDHVGARKLLAMGISRARRSVVIGFKKEEKSSLVGRLDSKTYQSIQL